MLVCGRIMITGTMIMFVCRIPVIIAVCPEARRHGRVRLTL